MKGTEQHNSYASQSGTSGTSKHAGVPCPIGSIDSNPATREALVLLEAASTDLPSWMRNGTTFLLIAAAIAIIAGSMMLPWTETRTIPVAFEISQSNNKNSDQPPEADGADPLRSTQGGHHNPIGLQKLNGGRSLRLIFVVAEDSYATGATATDAVGSVELLGLLEEAVDFAIRPGSPVRVSATGQSPARFHFVVTEHSGGVSAYNGAGEVTRVVLRPSDGTYQAFSSSLKHAEIIKLRIECGRHSLYSSIFGRAYGKTTK